MLGKHTIKQKQLRFVVNAGNFFCVELEGMVAGEYFLLGSAADLSWVDRDR